MLCRVKEVIKKRKKESESNEFLYVLKEMDLTR